MRTMFLKFPYSSRTQSTRNLQMSAVICMQKLNQMLRHQYKQSSSDARYELGDLEAVPRGWPLLQQQVLNLEHCPCQIGV